MNYRNAPGRNWARPARRRGANLQPEALPRESFAAWLAGGDNELAAGRNWAQRRRKPRRVHLEGVGTVASTVETYPLRERGGGDHDEPYTYRAPSTSNPLPFTLREYGHLLLLKGKVAAPELAGRS